MTPVEISFRAFRTDDVVLGVDDLNRPDEIAVTNAAVLLASPNQLAISTRIKSFVTRCARWSPYANLIAVAVAVQVNGFPLKRDCYRFAFLIVGRLAQGDTRIARRGCWRRRRYACFRRRGRARQRGCRRRR